VPSFAARLILAGILLAVATWTILICVRSKAATPSPDDPDQSRAPENLPINSLLEATLTGMREGLLVVNKDMRVVASNPAARKLFNPSVPALKAQRLTELTRNPASTG
jgi:PAS domain-containing protein